MSTRVSLSDPTPPDGASRRQDIRADKTPPHAVPLRPLEIVMLCDFQNNIAATVKDHIDGLVDHSRHNIRLASMLGELPPALDLDRFDVVVIHYTLVVSSDFFLSPAAREKIRSYSGLKAVFVQDEYRFVDRTTRFLRELGIDVLFTCIPEEEIGNVYCAEKLPGVHTVNVLTGYVPKLLLGRETTPYALRPVDVGYRARTLPAWLGALGQEKHLIGQRFANDAPDFDLTVDISCREEDRLYGGKWIDFLSRCKAMLGVESGSSVIDFSGDIQRDVEAHLAKHPNTGFEELREMYFPDQDGRIRINQISPRCFEASTLKTLMILYEGEYSGILEPGRHYVPLTKDHSNMADVVAVLRDDDRAGEIIERAYREVALNTGNSYAALAERFDVGIEQVFAPRSASELTPYGDAELGRAIRPSYRTRILRCKRLLHYWAWKLVFKFALGGFSGARRTHIQWRLRGLMTKLLRWR